MILAGTLAHIDATWRRFMPQFPVMRRFLDEDFEQLFRGESQQGQLDA